jgi:hypothetical protein
MPRLPADEPPSGALPDIRPSLRRGFRRRLLSLLVTSVVLAGASAAATAGATTAAYRLLNPPATSTSDTTSSSSSVLGAPQPGIASIRVKLLPYTRTAAGGIGEKGQYAKISGHPDPAVQQRINNVLHEPVARPHPLAPRASGASLATDAEVTLQTRWLLSVLYTFSIVPPREDLATGKWNWVKNFYRSESVIVDLTNGRRLGARDLFRPETLTPTGLQTLVERLMAAKQSHTARSCLELIRPEGRVELGKQIVTDPDALRLYPQHLSLRLSPDATLPLVCMPIVAEAPYDKIADLMRPEVIARVHP